MDDLPARLARRIDRTGPLPFDAFMDAALYDDDGFYGAGGGAGRAGRDFITSPETGSLFGALVARALDGLWERLGWPDPFVVVEAGAGRGALARDVLRAEPACAPALRYVLVERSRELRARQRELLALEPPAEVLGPVLVAADPDEPPVGVPGAGPIVTALAELPAIAVTGVVLANELLDNLAFRIVELTTDGWCEVRVTVDADGRFREVLVPGAQELIDDADPIWPVGTRLPLATGVASWLRACAAMLRRGFVVLVDYGAERDELVARGRGWLRTYAAHGRAAEPLEHPGALDITADVDLTALRRAAVRAGFDVDHDTTQSQWLRELGVDALVDAARSLWRERAGVGDLAALTARSRVSEAEALLDPDGLGAHRVVVLRRP